eukprot:125932_1
MAEYDISCRLTICGDSEVAVINDKVFNNSSNITTITEKNINIYEGILNIMSSKVKMKLYNLIGHENPSKKSDDENSNSVYIFYAKSHVIIVFFDITNKNSFDNIYNRWEDEIKHHIEHKMLYIVGMNDDKANSRKVSKNAINILVKELDAKYFEYTIMRNIEDILKDLIKETIITKKYNKSVGYYLERDGKFKVNMKFSTVNELLEKYKNGDECAGEILKRCKKSIVKNGVYFEANYKSGSLSGISELDFKDVESVHSITFNNIIAWDVTMPGEKTVLDKLVENADRLNEECKIRCFKRSMWDKNRHADLIHDWRLYALGVRKVKRIIICVNRTVLDAFIANAHPYQIWNKFSANLKNNKNVAWLRFEIHLNCMEKRFPLRIKKFSDILKCVEKSDGDIRYISLDFGSSADLCDYEQLGHNDPILRNVLYSSIIKFIKSKAFALEEFKFSYYNCMD